MAAHAPVRMPSSEWGGKDRPAYYRSASSQLRHQAHAVSASNSNSNNTNTNSNSNNPFASKDDPAPAPAPATASSGSNNPFAGAVARQKERESNSRDAHPDSPASGPVSKTQSQAETEDKAPTTGVKNTVGTAIESVSETVKPYLPGAIAAYLPTSAAAQCELPSKEVPSGSAVGVGSLPGTTSEVSVAKLPDERAMEQRQAHAHAKGHKAHHHKHGKHDAHGEQAAQASASASMYQTAKNYIRRSVGAYLPGSTNTSSLPSKETPSGSAIGVGSLPGTASEVSVAKLPEERRLEGLPSHETDHEVLGKSGGVGALPGGPNESRVALLPEERLHPQYDASSAGAGETGVGGGGVGRVREGAGAGAGSPLKKPEREAHTRVPGAFEQEGHGAPGAAAAGYGGTAAHPDVRMDPGYHPAALHPVDPKFQQREHGEKSASYASAAAGGEASRRSPESERSSNSSGERKKTGFMKKVKGEVKVISGKLSHNERKIEEGKLLKGK
ncbi:hypothetical protein C0993_008735 [Termitomyces sp. T159_Od127]|nr:hypothetical protein C0993_008735 [Termitomyces sp. T159_Od127]